MSDRLSRVSRAAETLRQSKLELRLALESARPHHTLEQLGKAAGVSRQAVQQMLKQKEEK